MAGPTDDSSKDDKPRRQQATEKRILVGARARFVVLGGAHLGRTYSFDQEIVIGRGSTADIVLEDTEISRRHARVWQTAGGDFMIEDLGSRNGSLVNGIPVTRSSIHLGDKIQLGSRVLLLFSARDPVEEQVLQRQRLEALGRLGAGVAHDFNNMLGVVMANLDYLRGRPAVSQANDENLSRTLQDMEVATKRAAQLAARLLGFARSAGQAHGLIEVSSVCQEISELSERTFGRGITVKTTIEQGLILKGNASEMHQVLMNLCLNARDAMPRGGTLTIGASRLAPTDEEGGPRVEVVVSDTGLGMDEVVRERIFEPFFTTKREGAGFGLGLVTVGEIVAAHGGRIEVQSERGQGSTFRLLLPATTSARLPRRVKETDPPPAAVIERKHAGAKVLVVDDEEIVRNSVSRILGEAGFVVELAVDGRDGVERYLAIDPRPDLVILNMDMPRLDGTAAIRELRAADPRVRVMMASGYFPPDAEEMLRAHGALALLHKPFGADALLRQVDQALDASIVWDEEITLDGGRL